MFQIRYKRTTRTRPHVDFTPLIDCAFILIIFFAVSTTLISTRTGMKLNLPEKSEVEPLAKHVQISISKTGEEEYKLFFEDLQVTKEILGAMVRSHLEKEPDAAFVLAAEPDVIYNKVIEVVDEISLAGGKMALQLNQKKPDSGGNTE